MKPIHRSVAGRHRSHALHGRIGTAFPLRRPRNRAIKLGKLKLADRGTTVTITLSPRAAATIAGYLALCRST